MKLYKGVIYLCVLLLSFFLLLSTDFRDSIPADFVDLTDAKLYLDNLQQQYRNDSLKWAEELDLKARDLAVNEELDQAIAFYVLCIEQREDVLKAGDTDKDNLQGIVRAYNNVGVYLRDLYRYQTAEEYLNTCLKKINAFRKDFGYYEAFRHGRAYQNLGRSYEETRGLSEAEWQYKQAIHYYDIDTIKSAEVQKTNQADVQNMLSSLYYSWDMPQLALESAEKSIQIYKEVYQDLRNSIFGTSDKGKALFLLDTVISNLSTAYFSRGTSLEMLDSLDSSIYSYETSKVLQEIVNRSDYDTLSRLQLLNKSRHLLDEIILSENSPGKILLPFTPIAEMELDFTKNYDHLSIVYRKRREFDKALALSNRAIQLTDEVIKTYPEVSISYSIEQAFHYHNRAEIYFDSGEYNLALHDQEKALSKLLYLEGSEQELILNENYFLEILAGKAKAQAAVNDLTSAKATYEEAITKIEEWRLQHYDRNTQLAISRVARKIFEGAILLEDDPKKAFKLSEKSRSYSLLNAFRNKVTIRDVKDEDLSNYFKLKLEIAQLKAQFVDTQDTILLNRINTKEGNLDNSLKKLNRNEAFRRAFGMTPVLSVEEVQQKLLTDNQAFVEYFVGEDTTIIFVLEKDRFHEPLKIPISKINISNWINEMRDGISQSALIFTQNEFNKIQSYIEASQKIYNELFYPVDVILEPDQIIIAPDDALYNIPFEALLTREPLEMNFAKFPYLINTTTISYTYSATLLDEAKRNKVTSNRLLAYSPSFEGQLSNERLGIDLHGGLKYTEVEVAELRQYFFFLNRFIRLGPKATKEKFLRDLKNRSYEFTHLATHAYANNENPGYSSIFFYGNGQVNETNLLFTRDIYSLTLRIQNCVLSACETQKGPVEIGEGIESISRALTFAGVNTVIASLWNANDRRTKDIMGQFYKGIKKESLSQAKAMQLAKKKLIVKEGLAPYYWASFIIIGNSEVPIEDTLCKFPVGTVLGLTFAGVLVLIFWRTRGRGDELN